jgi:hypothetical protein
LVQLAAGLMLRAHGRPVPLDIKQTTLYNEFKDRA